MLSGVARAKGRFGKTVVAQMLKGSGSEKMDKFGLNKLTTFGILPDFTQPELTQIIDSLSGSGHVECSDVDRFRPVVNLTETGWDWLKTRPYRPIPVTLPEYLVTKIQNGGLERAKRIEPPVVDSGEPAEEDGSDPAIENDPLFERIKTLRLQWNGRGRQRRFRPVASSRIERSSRLFRQNRVRRTNWPR